MELDCFGARLADYKSEIKGSKLLNKDRFKWAGYGDEIDSDARRQLCRSFLQAGLEKKSPLKRQFTAYGQACLLMADGILDILERYQARVFAAAVPRGSGKPPPGEPVPPDILRKDHAAGKAKWSCPFARKLPPATAHGSTPSNGKAMATMELAPTKASESFASRIFSSHAAKKEKGGNALGTPNPLRDRFPSAEPPGE